MLKRRTLLGILGVLVVLLLIGAWYADRRYGALLNAPKVSSADFAPENTSLRIGVNPGLAEAFILEKSAESVPVPQWLVSRALPYETVVMFSPDLEQNSSEVVVFINDKRFGPIIVDQLRNSNIPALVPYVNWDAEGALRPRKGVILLSGVMPIEDYIVRMVYETWGVVTPMTPMELEGGHFLETILDNRDGRGFATIAKWHALMAPGVRSSGASPAVQESASFRDTQGDIPDMRVYQEEKQIAVFMQTIASIRIWADIVSPTEMHIHIAVKGIPTIDEGMMDGHKFLASGGIQQLTAYCQQRGAQLTGELRREGLTLEGDYTLTNFEKVIGPLLGI